MIAERARADTLTKERQVFLAERANFDARIEKARNEITRQREIVDNLAQQNADLRIDRDADNVKLGIAERMVRYVEWAIEQKLIIPNETAELLGQVLREWKEAQ